MLISGRNHTGKKAVKDKRCHTGTVHQEYTTQEHLCSRRIVRTINYTVTKEIEHRIRIRGLEATSLRLIKESIEKVLLKT